MTRIMFIYDIISKNVVYKYILKNIKQIIKCVYIKLYNTIKILQEI